MASQEALKTAKAESARRLKTLQSLQQQGGEGPHLVANAAFLAEKTAREAADSKLITLRRSLAHKDDLIKSLKSKVGAEDNNAFVGPWKQWFICCPKRSCVSKLWWKPLWFH